MAATRRSGKRKEPLNVTSTSESSSKQQTQKKAKLEQQKSSIRKGKGKEKQTEDDDMMEDDVNDINISYSEIKDDEKEDQDEDDEEDDIDWETIQLPPKFEQELKTEDADNDTPMIYKDVEIVMETPRVVLK
jgi:xeroderma pigmentosum group C-complementing protein